MKETDGSKRPCGLVLASATDVSHLRYLRDF